MSKSKMEVQIDASKGFDVQALPMDKFQAQCRTD